MNYPTVLSPWFAVQRLDKKGKLEYYHSVEDGEPFRSTKGTSMLFTTLQSASRVALAEVAEVRVIFDKDGANEFGR